jgi:carbamoyl-phosphate synthase small subunit
MEVIERTSQATPVKQNPATAATLFLADGTSFKGSGLGERGATSGELVFTTAMTGYQEALTDPSYRGQILLFTYPLIGNYGVAPGHAQSDRIQASGAIFSTLSSPADCTDSLRELLLSSQIPVLYDVDTRAIAQWIRNQGATSAALALHDPGDEPSPEGLEGTGGSSEYDTTDFVSQAGVTRSELHGKSGKYLVALLDCGNKRSVTDELVRRNAQVAVLPARTRVDDIVALNPDGLVISNGPGNPAACTEIIETVRALYTRIPIFGICLGHQLLALAAGGSTFKLKFGHRGANHPVQDVETGRAFITTQNHGFAVDPDSLPNDLIVSHLNLNDGTVEGLRHRTLPTRSVQFHPEGAPGPKDAGVMLDEWLESLT